MQKESLLIRRNEIKVFILENFTVSVPHMVEKVIQVPVCRMVAKKVRVPVYCGGYACGSVW